MKLCSLEVYRCLEGTKYRFGEGGKIGHVHKVCLQQRSAAEYKRLFLGANRNINWDL